MKSSDKNNFINIDLSRGDLNNGGEKELMLTEFKPKKKQPESLRTEKQPQVKQELKMELVSNADNIERIEAKQAVREDRRSKRDEVGRSTTNSDRRRIDKKSASKSDNKQRELEFKELTGTPIKPEKPKSKPKNADPKQIAKLKKMGLIALALILVAIIVFSSYWFIRVDEIVIDGNDEISDEDIITLSGIREGDHFFTIDKEMCRNGIESATKLVYLGMDYELSGVLTITVRERYEAAQLMAGEEEYVVIDKEGIALDKSGFRTDYPLIKGIGITEYSLAYGVRVDDTSKFEKVCILLSEIEAHYLVSEISVIDIANNGDITMECNNGIKVDFGQVMSYDNVCRKMTWVQSVLPKLAEAGYDSGVLNVTSEQQATFEPDKGYDGTSAEVILSEIGEAVIPHG